MSETALSNNVLLKDSVYQRLHDHILAAAPNQALAPGVRLAEMFGVSHSTIRRVMQRFSEEGLVHKVRGRGTFVIERRDDGEEKALDETILYIDTWGAADNAFYARQLQGIMAQAEACHLRLQTLKIAEGWEKRDRLYEEAARPEIAGVILPWAPSHIVDGIRQVNPTVGIVDIAHRFPTGKVPCIRIDHYALGFQSLRWMANEGVEKVALVAGFSDTSAGVAAASREIKNAPAVLDLGGPPCYRHHTPNVPAICDALRDADVEGVIFDEDRTTLAILWAMARQGHNILAERRIVSHANAGEDLLPPEVVCFEFDGYQVGMLAMIVLKNLMDRVPLGNVAMLAGPSLRVPAAEDSKDNL